MILALPSLPLYVPALRSLPNAPGIVADALADLPGRCAVGQHRSDFALEPSKRRPNRPPTQLENVGNLALRYASGNHRNNPLALAGREMMPFVQRLAKCAEVALLTRICAAGSLKHCGEIVLAAFTMNGDAPG